MIWLSGHDKFKNEFETVPQSDLKILPLLTTAIGAFPKPDYVPLADWYSVREVSRARPTATYEEFLADRNNDVHALFDRATREVVRDQISAGIDVPTDGEIRREHYVYYHCRQIAGIDFQNLTAKTMRSGSWRADVPTITGPLSARAPFLAQDWRTAQAGADRPVKITVPGPMTIIDSTADVFYGDPAKLAAALADVINVEIRRLAVAGCQWIQVDEPVLARLPEMAVEFGIDTLARCFHGVPSTTNRVVHICCGYPAELDMEDYPKADAETYFSLADGLEQASIDVVSFEDAHRNNDLALLERFATTKIIWGVVDIANSRIEPVDDIVARLTATLDHIDANRLIAGPDCGLVMLGRDRALDKLRNLATAAKLVG